MLTQDEALWHTARFIAKGNNLGDLGTKPGVDVKLNWDITSSDANALFSLLVLYNATHYEGYLNLAKRIKDDVIYATKSG